MTDNEATFHGIDRIVQLALGQHSVNHKISMRITIGTLDGSVRQTDHIVDVIIVGTNTKDAIAAIKLHAHEDGTVQTERLVKMTPAAIRAMALRIADVDEATQKRKEKATGG